MARGTTLVKLLDMYRAECRMSLNPAQNGQDRDRQIEHIQRTQEWLWTDFNWPLLRVDRKFFPQAGQRYYDMPEDLDIDRITTVKIFTEQAYVTLHPGIDNSHFTAYNSDLNERQWPPRRWQISEDEQMELWPIPDGAGDTTTLDGEITITGIRKLKPLVKDTDRADLDDRLIILFCAAEYLASKGDKSANAKQQQANAHYAKLRGNQTPRKTFNMFGIGSADYNKPTIRVPIAVYNKTSG